MNTMLLLTANNTGIGKIGANVLSTFAIIGGIIGGFFLVKTLIKQIANYSGGQGNTSIIKMVSEAVVIVALIGCIFFFGNPDNIQNLGNKLGGNSGATEKVVNSVTDTTEDLTK